MYIIKQLRREKNLSQTQLANEIGVSLRTIQLYERKGANIPMKNLSKIASIFEMSIAEMYLRDVNESGEIYGNKKPFLHFGNTCYHLDHGKILIRTPLLFVEDQKKYVENLTRKVEENHSITGSFVIEFLEKGSYKAFEITGDSMDDGSIDAVPNKAIVLGLKLDKKTLTQQKNLPKRESWVLVLNNRIICKCITGINKAQNRITCHNLNSSPEYRDFEIGVDEVMEVYKVVKKQI